MNADEPCCGDHPLRRPIALGILEGARTLQATTCFRTHKGRRALRPCVQEGGSCSGKGLSRADKRRGLLKRMNALLLSFGVGGVDAMVELGLDFMEVEDYILKFLTLYYKNVTGCSRMMSRYGKCILKCF